MWQLYIFIFALVLRLVYLFQTKSVDPIFNHPIMDALYHHEWAISIIKGDWFGSDAFFRAPLYPYFLSLLYRIFGINLLIPRIVQSLIGSFSCVLVAKIGTMLFRKRIGIVAGIIMGVYPLFIYFDNELLIPTLLIFLVVLGFYLIVKQSSLGVSKLGWFITGIVWGLAAITRPNVLLFLAILPIWLFKKLKTSSKAAALYGALGVLSMILPVTIRNYVVSKEFVPIAWQGGTNFYIGNNPFSDGWTAIIPGTRTSWWGGFEDAKRIAETEMGRKLKNSEIDQFWLKQGLKFFKKQPLNAFNLLLKKTYLFFGGYEISNNRDIYFFTRFTYLKFLIFNLPFFQFPLGVIFPLSLLGVFILIMQKKSGWYAKKKRSDIFLMLIFIISYSLSFILFFVCARFRLAIIPFLIIFASYAIHSIIDGIKKRRFKNLLIPLLFFILTFLFFNADVYNVRESNTALNYITLAGAYKKTGRTSEALDSYRQAIEIDPYRAGVIFAQAGHHDIAKDVFLKAIENGKNTAEAYSGLGEIFYRTGEYDRALKCFNTTLNLKPDSEIALYYAGLIHKKLGNVAEAESLWQKALTINPYNELVEIELENIHRP